MKKNLFLVLAFFTVIIGYPQINTNAIEVNGLGDLKLKRFGTGDTNFKNALSVVGSGANYSLNLNYGGQFSDGVRIFGKTEGEEFTISASTTISKRIGFSTHDQFSYMGYPMAHYGLTFRPGNHVGLSGHSSLELFTASTLRMKIASNGKVGIGTSNPDEKLTVKGKIHAEEVKVDLAVPADYVFQKYFTGTSELKPEYTMLTLAEVESFVKENNHLPSIPSAEEIRENGLQLGEMNNLLLQKVEELTLYIIEQNKRIEALEANVFED